MRKALSTIHRRAGNGITRRLNTRITGSVVDEGQSSIAIPSNLKLSIRCLEAVRKRESIGGVGIENTKHPSNGFVKLSDEGLLRVPVLNVPWEDSNFAEGETENEGVGNNEDDTWIDLDPTVFGVPVRRDVVHDVIRWQRAGTRQGTAKCKSKSEVSGSGAKARQQKGTGRARAGTKRPPHWRGGGVAHGPKGNRDWSFKLNKKVRKLGLRSALSARLLEGRLSVVERLEPNTHKTAEMAKVLEKMKLWNSTGSRSRSHLVGSEEKSDINDGARVLLVEGREVGDNLALSTRNLRGVHLLTAQQANCLDIIRCRCLVLTREAVKLLAARLHAN